MLARSADMASRRALARSLSSLSLSSSSSHTSANYVAIPIRAIHSQTRGTQLFDKSATPTHSIFIRPSALSSSLSFPSLARHSLFRRGFARFGAGDESNASANNQQQQQQQQQKQEGGEGAAAGEKPEGEGNAGLGVLIILGGVGGIAYFIYWFLSEKPQPTEEELQRAARPWYASMTDTITGAHPILGPEQLDAAGRRPRTVVLSFDKTIVHCDWSRATGWEVRKRPGVDRLIERLHLAGYELILWAASPSYEVEPTLAELDPLGYFKHKLYSDHTNFRFNNGVRLVKDLNRLQRDPKRLIVIDTNKRTYEPIGDNENVIVIPEFVDDINDQYLRKLCALLENVKRYNIHDVTSVVRRFNENPDADLFVKEREAAAEASKNLRGEKADKKEKKSSKNSSNESTEAAPVNKQSWGSWLKSFVSSSPSAKSS